MRMLVPGTQVPPTILWLLIRVFRGMDLLLFHISLPEVGTMWDPDGLPAAYPCGHRYLTKEQETRNSPTKKSVHMGAQAVTQSMLSVLRNCVEPLSTPTRSDREHSIHVERKRDKNNAQPSKCNSEYMSWTWFGIVETNSRMVHEVAKRPSPSSAARRIPSNSSNSENEKRKFSIEATRGSNI